MAELMKIKAKLSDGMARRMKEARMLIDTFENFPELTKENKIELLMNLLAQESIHSVNDYLKARSGL